MRESTRRHRLWRRSSRARPGGEGVALVTTTANGGEDRARPSRERVRETRGREGRSAGRCWASPWRSVGDEEAAGGGRGCMRR